MSNRFIDDDNPILDLPEVGESYSVEAYDEDSLNKVNPILPKKALVVVYNKMGRIYLKIGDGKNGCRDLDIVGNIFDAEKGLKAFEQQQYNIVNTLSDVLSKNLLITIPKEFE